MRTLFLACSAIAALGLVSTTAEAGDQTVPIHNAVQHSNHTPVQTVGNRRRGRHGHHGHGHGHSIQRRYSGYSPYQRYSPYSSYRYSPYSSYRFSPYSARRYRSSRYPYSQYPYGYGSRSGIGISTPGFSLYFGR